jgi:hypothetical protein
MYDLTSKSHLRRYDLSYQEGTIRIHMVPSVAQSVRLQLLDFQDRLAVTTAEYKEQKNDIGEFVLTSDALGFSGVLRELELDGETVWVADLPDLKIDGQVAGMRLSSSLWIVFNRLMSVAPAEGETRFQLMAVDVFASPRMDLNGFPLSVKFSAAMVNWLGRHVEPSFTLPEIEAMLRDAWESLWPSMRNTEFHAYIRSPGDLFLGCPGNATGLAPNHVAQYRDTDEGYELDCHNVDGPLQQLTLLAGLARLNERARRL